MLTDQMVRERGDALKGIANGVAGMLSEGLYERLREVELHALSSSQHGLGLDEAS